MSKPMRLRIPSVLAVTALGVSLASCGASTSHADASADVADAALAATCDAACMAMLTEVNPLCVPETGADGAVECVQPADGGGTPGECFATLAMSATGACCCDPII